MKDASPWTITASRSVDSGYTETVCIKCTNELDTHQIDDIRVEQEPNPCLGSLVAKKQLPSNPQVFNYKRGSTELIANWQDMITNQGGSDCNPTGCGLYGSGCSIAYSDAYPAGKITMKDNFPWSIDADVGDFEGWTETICIRCKNSLDEQAFDNFAIT